MSVFFMKFNSLIPELSVSNVSKSLSFYCDVLGFKKVYDRESDGFYFIQYGNAQIMLEQQNEHWKTGKLEHPYGRGINFQVITDEIDNLLDRLQQKNIPLFRELAINEYMTNDGVERVREFLVKDPDGYLLRFSE